MGRCGRKGRTSIRRASREKRTNTWCSAFRGSTLSRRRRSFRDDAHAAGGVRKREGVARPQISEFGAEQEYLRGKIHPQGDGDEGSGGAVSRVESGAAQIQ